MAFENIFNAVIEGRRDDVRAGVTESLEAGKTQGAGMGIGLALCKMLVELHGGEIWVKSKGRGTSISFTLPVASDSSVTADKR